MKQNGMRALAVIAMTLLIGPPSIAQDDAERSAVAGEVSAVAAHEHHQSAGNGAASTGALFNAADLLFLQHMIVHHEQAVVMAPMVRLKSSRREFVRFSDYVGRAQAVEIDTMRALLDLAAERGLAVPQAALEGDPPMPGMLSSAQMEALESARGPEFERLWLEGMIYHHQGAIDMAQNQQRQQLASGRRPYQLDVLVEDIIEEQRAEITRMRAWLEAWGLAREP